MSAGRVNEKNVKRNYSCIKNKYLTDFGNA